MKKLIFDLHSKEISPVETKESSCLLCGNKEGKEVNRFKFNDKIFKTVICKKDGMMYLQPQLTEELYRKIYEKEYHLNKDPSLIDQLTAEVADDYVRRENDAKKRVNEIESFKPAGNLLEIGCGPRFVLKEAKKRGWNVEGVELSNHFKEDLEKENIRVHVGDFLEMNLKPENYDAIAMYSLLEHLLDPKAYLTKIKKLLKKDGIIVLRIPNTLKEGPRLHLLVHLYHFNLETIIEFLKQNKFSPQKINLNSGAYKSKKYNFEAPNMHIVATVE